MENTGIEMYSWARDLFPINRSITGNGVRETLSYLKKILPELRIKEVASGTNCFDWTVPLEWNVKEAFIEDEHRNRIIDFKDNNLHLVGYSIPVDLVLDYDKLREHLFYLEKQPDAIPYITSYYDEKWGFCLTYNQFKTLKKGKYRVKIDSTLERGFLTYGEIVLKGRSSHEIFLSTYVCHPSMANNELSGPVVTTALVNFIKQLGNRKYTYRVIFIPETIGSICYLSKNIETMKKNVLAGFNISTIGDNRSYSYVPSRNGNTLADKVILHVLNNNDLEYNHYTFLDRGSDERQYCAPGVDLPVVTLCRTKYAAYPEYHTSLDNLDLISSEGLFGGYNLLRQAIQILERNEYYKTKTICEPQLGKRGLYPTLSTKGSGRTVRNMMNFICYADGSNDLIDIANLIKVNATSLFEIIENLLNEKLIEIEDH